MTGRYEASVVGAGIVGLSLALTLLENGFKTLLIDKCWDPCGATRFSGGVFTRILEDEDEFRWSLKSHEFYMKYLRKAEFVHWGYLILEEERLVYEDYEEYKTDVDGLKILHEDEIHDILGIPVKLDEEAGLYIEKDFTLNPSRLTSYLKSKYQDMGGEFIVSNYKRYSSGDYVKVFLEDVEIDTEKLFICLGPWGEDIPGRYSSTRLISIPIYKFNVPLKTGFWDETLYGYFRVEDGGMVGGFYDAYGVNDPESGFGEPREESIKYALDMISLRLGYKPDILEMWSAPVALSYNYTPYYQEVDKNVYVFNGFGGRGIILGPGFIRETIPQILKDEI